MNAGAGTVGVALALAVAAMPARADPRLDEKVYSPYIENHVLEVENRWGEEFGAGSRQGAATLVEEIEAGLSDRISLALVTQVERTPGSDQRLTGVGLEGVAYLGQVPRIGVDAGLYLEYRKGVGGQTDGGEAKLLLAKTAGRFQGLLNLMVEHPFGASAGASFASYGYAASATWRTAGNLRLGAEVFGGLGDDHGFLRRAHGAYVGPEVKWEGKPAFLPVEVELTGGWVPAAGSAHRESASQGRINLEFNHRF